MIAPDILPLELINARHPDYLANQDVWEILDDLRAGSVRLRSKAAKYIPMRPGEEPDLYQLRLNKFSHTPIMSTAIRELVAKLTSSPVSLVGADSPVWSEWILDTDSEGSDQLELVGKFLSSLLYFGRLFVSVDRPAIDYEPTSKATEPGELPYVSIWEPLAVINWGEDYYVTYTLVPKSSLTAKMTYVASWTVWSDQETSVFRAEVELDRLGNFSRIKTPEGKWVAAGSPKAIVAKVSQMLHSYGEPMLVMAQLPNEAWVGNLAYLKQLQHTMIESSWTDAGSVAGTIQRVFTPSPPKPMDDPRLVLESQDYSDLKFDNQHVLVGSGFTFAESSGVAIAALTAQLDKIEYQIRSLVSMGWMTNQESGQQSLVSKDADMSMLNNTLKTYGKTTSRLYERTLALVAYMLGLPEPSVQGLDTFSVDSLNLLLTQTEQLLLVSPALPLTAWRIWVSKIVSLMVGEVSEETRQLIDTELEQVGIVELPANNNLTDTNL